MILAPVFGTIRSRVPCGFCSGHSASTCEFPRFVPLLVAEWFLFKFARHKYSKICSEIDVFFISN